MARLDWRAVTRVLVTGGTGFLGRPIVAGLIRRGCEVHMAGRSAAGDLPGIHHPCDLLAPGAAAGLVEAVRPDAIVHAAWFVDHGRFWSAPENLDWVGASLSLVRAAADRGVPRFVGLGTCAEYDWSDATMTPRRETDPLRPSTLYGEAKVALFHLASRALAPTATEFAWARIFHPFGPGEPPAKLASSVAAGLRAGATVPIRSGPLLRDFISAEDVGEAVAALMVSPVVGPVNIGTGRSTSIRVLAETIASIVAGPGRLAFEDPPPGAEPPAMLADVARLRTEVGVVEPPALAERLRAWLAPQTASFLG